MSAFQRSVQIFYFLHFFFIYRHCDHYVNISNIVIYDIIAYCDNPNTMETVGLFPWRPCSYLHLCVCVLQLYQTWTHPLTPTWWNLRPSEYAVWPPPYTEPPYSLRRTYQSTIISSHLVMYAVISGRLLLRRCERVYSVKCSCDFFFFSLEKVVSSDKLGWQKVLVGKLCF